MTAALLMRTDSDIFCFYVGDDPHGTAAALSSGHYFGVAAVLMAIGDEAARGRFDNLVSAIGATPLGQGWWTGAPLEAMASAFARACCQRPTAAFCEKALCKEATCEEATCEEPIQEEAGCDELWAYVETCSPSEADKATVIRSALDEKLGKVKAKQLLACVRSCTAQDQSGHKNKVLKVASNLGLRLRP